MIYIYHHLGLGDHISCHGIVRHFCEIEDKVFLFVKPHNIENVKRMFIDIENLEFIEADDSVANDYINKYQIKNLIKIGFTLNDYENFELQFYKMAGVPIDFKYSKFYVQRDLKKEKEIFGSLDIKEGEYVFVHDGGHLLRENLIDKNLKVVKPNGYGLFDWMYVIENAKEIHCIDSSFICLVDCMDTKQIPLYNHRYLRNYPDSIISYPKKQWNLIN